jgi:hypothetical protein
MAQMTTVQVSGPGSAFAVVKLSHQDPGLQRNSTLGYLSPMSLEMQTSVRKLVSTKPAVAQVSRRPWHQFGFIE